VIEQELGPFDAPWLVPAFVEGGRTTVGGCNLLQRWNPVATLPLCRRQRFMLYATSFLPELGGSQGVAEGGRRPRWAGIGPAELEPRTHWASAPDWRPLAGNPLAGGGCGEGLKQLRALGAALAPGGAAGAGCLAGRGPAGRGACYCKIGASLLNGPGKTCHLNRLGARGPGPAAPQWSTGCRASGLPGCRSANRPTGRTAAESRLFGRGSCR